MIKLAFKLTVGDSICYRVKDLKDQGAFSKSTIPLSGTILKIEELDDGTIEITTVSGCLKPCSKFKAFVLENQSDKTLSQSQYVCPPAETFEGFSID